MPVKKCLWILPLLMIGGCESESDDVIVINNFITEAPIVTTSVEPAPIGQFELQTALETSFFAVEKEINSGEFYYSNSNAFHFDKDGYLVNSFSLPLMVFPVNPDGSSASVSLSTSSSVRIGYSYGSPKATDRVNISINLPQASGELSVNEFDNNDPLTFNNSTSLSVISSLGDVHVLTLYFIHVSADNNTWEFRIALDGNTVQPITEQVLDFDSGGLMDDINDDDLDGFITTGNGLIENINISLNSGASDLNFTLDFTSDVTSYNSNFEVTSLEASGYYQGHIKQFKIESDGLITLSYTNGEDELIGRIALNKFISPYNLQPLDNGLWAETENSGARIAGEAESSNFGSIIPIVHDF